MNNNESDFSSTLQKTYKLLVPDASELHLTKQYIETLLSQMQIRKADEVKIKFGTHPNGLEKIVNTTDEFESPVEYVETFVNRNSKLNNEWSKIVTFSETKKLYSNSIIYSCASQDEIVECNAFHVSEFFIPKDANPIQIKVKRQTRIHKSSSPKWKIFIDEVTFPDGDPHLICSIVFFNTFTPYNEEEMLTIEQFMKGIYITPVRSKIIEYLYRYERKLYMELQAKNIIKKCNYKQCTSPAQMEIVVKLTNYYIILQRFNGISSKEYETLKLEESSDEE